MTIYTNIKTMTPGEYRKARQDAVLGKLTLKAPINKAVPAKETGSEAAPKVPVIRPANQSAEDNRTVRYALKEMAKKAGIKNIDDLSLTDISSVSVNDKDEIEGGEEFIAALKTARPYFFNEK